MANAPQQQPVSSLTAGMAAHIQNNINGILGNPHDPNPGQTLQHYVSQFQDDPSHYTPVLAMASATQNHLATQKQLSQQQQQQPPVAQQTFNKLAPQAAPQQAPQAMPQQAPQQAPQSSGIGQLPAANMESMAEGGITGYSGSQGSYVNPAQESMMSGISADQALQSGYLNPLNSYGANESQGSIQGVPLKKGGGVKHFDDGGQVNGVRQPMGMNDPLRIAMQNMGYTGASTPDAAGTQGIPMYQMPLNPAAEFRQASAGNAAAPQATPSAQPAPATAQGIGNPNMTLQSTLGQGAITPQSFMGTSPAPTPQDAAPVSPGITALPQAAAAKLPGAGIASSFGMDPASFAAKGMAAATAQYKNPEDAHSMQVSTQLSEIQDAMKQAGVDPTMSKSFDRLQAMQDKSDALLDKKQSLSIISAGLGMIQPGNPWVAIAAGAQKGTKEYSDALDQHQATMQKLGESQVALDAARTAMLNGNVGLAVKNQEEAQNRNLQYVQSQVQGYNKLYGEGMAAQMQLEGHKLMAGATIQAEQMRSQTQLGVAGIYTQGRSDVAGQRVAGQGTVAGQRAYEDFAKNYLKTPGANPANVMGAAISAGIIPSGMSLSQSPNTNNMRTY